MKKICLFIIVLISFSTFHVHAYEKPIRGIYVKAENTNGAKFQQLLNLVNSTELNAMVIDVKDDHGNLTYHPESNSPYFTISQPYIKNPKALIQTMKAHNIYPIARIVVFKDNVLAKKNPNLSFHNKNGLWKNARGDSFTNPFLKEVWDYNLGIAKEAVKMGFAEIQFDYVRFPEKFVTFEKQLHYSRGNYRTIDGRERIRAVSDFVSYARQTLKPLNVKMSVDVFGNATVIPEAQGIGQNFSMISENVDVISAMIYPSHWTGIFGIHKPDLEPFRLVKGYAKVEKERLQKLANRPISRTWLQDFTAAWLGKGNYQIYGKKEIEDQIRALHSEGIHEFLLWNAGNNYTPNVDYSPY